MDSTNLSEHLEPRAAIGAEKELMLLLVFLCDSNGSRASTPVVEPRPDLSFGQNNQRDFPLVDPIPVTRVPL